MSYLNGLVVVPTFFNLSLNLAIRSSPESGTMQVSVETLMNKIGLAPVPKSEDAVITAQRRDDVFSTSLLDCYAQKQNNIES